jgi:hypothetical protein
MKYTIEIPEVDSTEIVRLHLKGCYDDLKSLYERNPNCHSKKDLKALKLGS